MNEIACQESWCQQGVVIIPPEYQGWSFLVFMIIGFALVIYGFYFMAVYPIINETPGKRK